MQRNFSKEFRPEKWVRSGWGLVLASSHTKREIRQEEGDTIIRGGKAVEARCGNGGDEGVEAHQGAVGGHDEGDR